MAVAAADPAIKVVDSQLRTLIAAGFPPLTDGFLLRVVVAAGAIAATAFYVPAP